jgi:acetyltransferase
MLAEPDALEILRAYDFPHHSCLLTHTPDDAVAAAARVGYPVVLRIVSPDIVHKTEFGGVALSLVDEAQVRAAWERMYQRAAAKIGESRVDGILVRRMIPAGRELILGLKRDAALGPVLMCGLGGIYVELLRDIVFRIAPVSDQTALEMLAGLRGAALLRGIRGEPPADVAAVADVLSRLSQLAIDCPGIVELDINPLIVQPAGQGCCVADVRMRIERRPVPRECVGASGAARAAAEQESTSWLPATHSIESFT